MCPKIFIYPGIGKTATSAIQNLAFINLRDNSVCEYFPFGLIGNVHNGLADLHPNFNSVFFATAMASFDQLSKAKNYLISSEFLCFSSKVNIQTLLNKIVDSGFKAEVIFVVREFSKLLLSAYLQALKTGYGLVRGESYYDYVERTKSQFNLVSLIDKWNGIPEVTIKILSFDKYSDGFVKKFFGIIGCDSLIKDDTLKLVNESLLAEFIPLIRNYDNLVRWSLEDKDSMKNRTSFVQDLLALSKKYKHLTTPQEYELSVKTLTEEMNNMQFGILRQKYEFI